MRPWKHGEVWCTACASPNRACWCRQMPCIVYTVYWSSAYLGFGDFWILGLPLGIPSPTAIQVRRRYHQSEGFRGLQRTSDSLKEPQRASEGLVGSPGAYIFLVFFISSFFFHFSPTGFESDTILSPTSRDFPGSPGSPFLYADACNHVVLYKIVQWRGSFTKKLV